MAHITMYGSQRCSLCSYIEQLLKQKGVTDFVKILIDTDIAQRAQMIARTGQRAVPQIFIDDTHVGGYADLLTLDRRGRLDDLLSVKC